MKKQDKRNWPKAVIQILSFLLIPGLFEAQFSAVGTIISAVYQGTVSWERIRYSVWMVLATVPAVIIVGRFFCGYFCSFGAVQDFLWFAGNKLKKRFRKQVRKTCIQIQRRVEEMFQQAGSNMVCSCSGQSSYGAV